MNKFRKFLFIFVPILIVLGSTTTYFLVSSFKNKAKKTDNIFIKNPNNQPPEKNIIPQSSEDIYQDIKIFPDLTPSHFYSYIRMAEGNSKPIINNKMISYIIKYIIQNMNITQGKILIGIKKVDESNVKIQISWKHNYKVKKYEYSHTYLFSAINSI